jgi:hypothetical protein
VQVRLSIKCTTCQRASPLSRLDMEGRYYCYGCNREQLFDADIWKENVLFLASGLGDALGSYAQTFPPWPPNAGEGRSHETVEQKIARLESHSGGLDDVDDMMMMHLLGKCDEIGRTTGGLTVEREGMSMGGGGMRTRGIVLAMSPGHPLCAQCKTPLQTQTRSDGVVMTSCSRCNLHETYRLPPAAKSVCKDLCGVIAPEHVEGREAARITSQPGAALAVVCPKCGSGLQLAAGERITHCAYCKTTAIVPEHIGAASPPTLPDPLWLAFRSPSSVRTLLIEDAKKVEAKATADARASDAKRRAEEEARLEAEASPPAPQRVDRLNSPAAWITSALTVIVFGVFFLFRIGAFDSKPNKDTKHEGDHRVVTTPPATIPTATSKPVSSDPVAITSCSCTFGDSQSTPQITLTVNAPPSGASRGWSLSIGRLFGSAVENRTAELPAAPGAVLPPLLDAGAPTHMGVACDTGIFVLVADKVATGWSSVNGAWEWNATLPSRSIDAADAAATASSGTDYTGGCSLLAVKNGAASLNLANGKHVSLSLNDGKIR